MTPDELMARTEAFQKRMLHYEMKFDGIHRFWRWKALVLGGSGGVLAMQTFIVVVTGSLREWWWLPPVTVVTVVASMWPHAQTFWLLRRWRRELKDWKRLVDETTHDWPTA